MQFGKVDPGSLSQIDFSLPPDSEVTKLTLGKVKKSKRSTEVRVGGAKWGRKDWIGKLYPKGTKEKDFLQEYGRLFSCIELNAMFYQLYPPSTIEKWVEKVGPDFKFCPKFYQGITHLRRLKNAEHLTSAFLESIHAFGNKLGPCFMQLHDNFGPKNFETLMSYLDQIPTDLEMFIEVRNKDWYVPEHAEQLAGYLRERNVGWAISDTAGRRDCVHMHLPVPKAFIRFVGCNLHPTDFTRTDEWARRIKQWNDHGIELVYYFIHQ
ncbi:MAG TPA: DUF72 domain-containing protein, partial [Saprospiraceae bacterium]|nr:DUF72 domain-containing protein [Saprospiraceae bacterium]